MNNIDDWIKLKYIVENIFGKDNRVVKTTSPILSEEGTSPEIREIDGWEITADYGSYDIVEYEYLANFKEEIENLGYVFVDYYLSLNEEFKKFRLYAIIVKKEMIKK